jgi:hypothetical protein
LHVIGEDRSKELDMVPSQPRAIDLGLVQLIR